MSRTDGKTKKEKRVGSGGKEGRKGWARRRSARERVGNGGKRVGRGRKKGERRVEKRRKGFPKRSGARKSVKEGRKNGAYKPVFGRGSSRRAGPIKSDPPGKMPILQKTTADSAAAGAHTAGAAVTGAAGAAVARAAEVDQDQGNDDHPYDFVVKKVAKTVHFSSSFKENRGAGGFANDRVPECLPSAPLLYHCMQGRTN